MSDEDGHISVPKAHMGAPLFPLPSARILCTLCPQYSAVRVCDSALTAHFVLRVPVKPEAGGVGYMLTFQTHIQIFTVLAADCLSPC